MRPAGVRDAAACVERSVWDVCGDDWAAATACPDTVVAMTMDADARTARVRRRVTCVMTDLLFDARTGRCSAEPAES